MNPSTAPVTTDSVATTLRRALLMVAAAATLACLLVIVHQSRDLPAGYYAPTGYYERVREMIDNQVLVFHEPGSHPDGGDAPWGWIDFHHAKARPVQSQFLKHSGRLRADLRHFREHGSDGLFQVGRDGGLSINTWTHNISLPFPQRETWRGSFSFRGDPLPSLASEQAVFGFAMDPANRSSRPAAPERGIVSPGSWLPSTSESSTPNLRRARAYDFLSPAGTGALLRFEAAGESVVMECVEGAAQALVQINGTIVNRGDSTPVRQLRKRGPSLPPNHFLLQPGDRLRINLTDRQTDAIFRIGRYGGGIISRAWIEDGRTISRIDPEVARQIPYLSDLHHSMQRLASSHPDAASLRHPSIQITLDRALHTDLQQRLETYIDRFDRTDSTVPDIIRQPAAIAVLDALTGEVLALPSHPSPRRLEHLENLAAAGTIEPLSQSERQRLERNQNLAAVPIGSTAKPIFAAALWHQYPELRRLVVDEPANHLQTIHGLRLNRPLATTSHAREVGPVDFLAYSSNTYAVQLYFITLANEQSWRIGRDGRLLPAAGFERPDFSGRIQRDLIPGGIHHPDELPAHELLRTWFDVDLVPDHSANVGQHYDSAVWSTLFAAVGLDPADPPPALHAVLPARTNFNLSAIDTVRGELCSFLLGGFTNRWSNLKLAEAYARLGTGRRVQATLVVPNRPAEPPSLGIHPQVTELLHQGLTDAIGHGTARRLQPTLNRLQSELNQQGLELRAMAKTGTAARLPGRDCAALCLYLEIRPARGQTPLAALSTSIYLQDRGTARAGAAARNSGVAVILAADLLPSLVAHLKQTDAVRQHLARR